MKIIASLTAMMFVFGMAAPSLAAVSPDEEVLITSVTAPAEPAPIIAIGEDSTATATLVPDTTKPASTKEDAPASPSLRGYSSTNSYSEYSKNEYNVFLKSDHSKCLSFYLNDSNFAKMVTCDDNDDYQYWYYEGGYIKNRHNSYNGWCLTYDIHHHDRYLRMSPCNGESNQKWNYNDKDWRFRSSYDQRYCMDYCRDCGGYVHAKLCDGDASRDQEYFVGNNFF